YSVPHSLHSFPTRRSSDLPISIASPSTRPHFWQMCRTITASGGLNGPSLANGRGFSSGTGDRISDKNSRTLSRINSTFESAGLRSEEHTSELQSLAYLVCR